jgi:hypothetical protein
LLGPIADAPKTAYVVIKKTEETEMMNLTSDMTRLRGEIDAMRNVRQALMKSLAAGARATARSVEEMQNDFAATRIRMARKTKKERTAFLSELRKSVNRIKKETAADLAGARCVWSGKVAKTK